MLGREQEGYGIARMGRGVDTNNLFERGGEVCLRLRLFYCESEKCNVDGHVTVFFCQTLKLFYSF
jgi:hypothetical protein